MIDFAIRFIFVCGVDTLFTMCLIFILSFNKKITAKDVLTWLALNSISYYLQTLSFLYVFIDIIFYYFIFKLFYIHTKKLLSSIFLSFTILATITALIYSPIILAFNLDTNSIYNNTIYLLIIRIPLIIAEIFILILIRRKKKNENRRILNKTRQ